MTKLLIVEDDINKRDQIAGLLARSFPLLDVVETVSLIGGVQKLRSWKPDIVLLDMTLPNYDPEGESNNISMEAFGGEEFLKQVDRFGLSPLVIVVTQFETFGEEGDSKNRDELDLHLRLMFPSTYRGMIYYHASLNGWADELEGVVNNMLKGFDSK